jgi:hypothetical protein
VYKMVHTVYFKLMPRASGEESHHSTAFSTIYCLATGRLFLLHLIDFDLGGYGGHAGRGGGGQIRKTLCFKCNRYGTMIQAIYKINKTNICIPLDPSIYILCVDPRAIRLECEIL